MAFDFKVQNLRSPKKQKGNQGSMKIKGLFKFNGELSFFICEKGLRSNELIYLAYKIDMRNSSQY